MATHPRPYTPGLKFQGDHTEPDLIAEAEERAARQSAREGAIRPAKMAAVAADLERLAALRHRGIEWPDA